MLTFNINLYAYASTSAIYFLWSLAIHLTGSICKIFACLMLWANRTLKILVSAEAPHPERKCPKLREDNVLRKGETSLGIVTASAFPLPCNSRGHYFPQPMENFTVAHLSGTKKEPKGDVTRPGRGRRRACESLG